MRQTQHETKPPGWNFDCGRVTAGSPLFGLLSRAYLDFTHLDDLSMRYVFCVTRAKDNLQFRVVRRFQRGRVGHILRDDLIELTGTAQKAYPVQLCRVVALVEVD